MSKKYYSLKNIDKEKAEYNLIIGERSNGKSYAVKQKALTEAWYDTDKKFIYLRRWGLDIKMSLVEAYFRDCPVEEITGGEFDSVSAYQGKIYFARSSEDGKIIRGQVIGYYCALSLAEHYKSGAYPDCDKIIFEEFITDNMYLPHEPDRLQHFVSTISRERKISVYMIGNSISRVCPYFQDWALTALARQQVGTINTYQNDDIKIAVELCASDSRGSMFFGQVSKQINRGEWYGQVSRKLLDSEKNYEEIHRLVFENKGFKFLMKLLSHRTESYTVWYVEPLTKDYDFRTRIVSDTAYNTPFYTPDFTPLSRSEGLAFGLMDTYGFCFSDNTTYGDFKQCIAKTKIRVNENA